MLEKKALLVQGATTKNFATPVRDGTRHKVQDTKIESCPNKDSTKTQDNRKRLEKNSEKVEFETKSEEAKASPVPVGLKRGQVVQVWFGRKKRSPRGSKGAEDNQIEAKQS